MEELNNVNIQSSENRPKRERNPYLVKKRAKQITFYVVVYALLTLGAVTMLYPYLWMLSTSFKSGNEVTNNFGVYIIPKEFTAGNYGELLQYIPFFKGLLNTMIIEVTVIVAGTLTTAMAAFAFAKLRFPGRDAIFLVLLTGMMIPYVSVMMPQYSMFSSLGMADTLWPLILPGLFGNIGMMFFIRSYAHGLPDEIFDAAKVDGAGYFRQFYTLMIPLSVPAIVTQVIFWFLGIWNDVLGPDIYLSTLDNKTLQVMLKYLDTQGGGGGTLRLQPLMMAGAVLSSLPVLAIYLGFQKYFVNSMVLSGLKD